MDDRQVAALTHFTLGGLTLLKSVSSLVNPKPDYHSGPLEYEFLFTYGGAISGVVAGVALIGLGILTRRAKDPAEKATSLHFMNEAELPLRGLLAGFLMVLAIVSFVSIVPHVAERGLDWAQLGAVAFLIPLLLWGSWIILHYRRLVLFDAGSRTFVHSYGKPWAALTFRYPYADFDQVIIHPVERSRGTVYRIVATGRDGRQKLITFTFSADGAKSCVDSIVRETGWKADDTRLG
jgi:hypothetical protein